MVEGLTGRSKGPTGTQTRCKMRLGQCACAKAVSPTPRSQRPGGGAPQGGSIVPRTAQNRNSSIGPGKVEKSDLRPADSMQRLGPSTL